jgi:hypothetical protein
MDEIVFGIVCGLSGFIVGWFGAWVAGAFKSLTEEERRVWDKLNKHECKCKHEVCEEWRE